VVLSANQKAAHPKYSKVRDIASCTNQTICSALLVPLPQKSSKVVFADFTVSRVANQVAVAAGWPAPVQPPAKKAKK
jgi:hypothetical protein